jgi:hypothetical protein
MTQAKQKAFELKERFDGYKKRITTLMTTIEEANRLVDEMLHCFQGSIDAYTAKQCALIAVERLIDESRQQENVLRFKYWREVKKHLDNDSTRSQESEELYPQ